MVGVIYLTGLVLATSTLILNIQYFKRDKPEDGIHSGFFTGSLAKEEVFEILYSSDGIDDTIQELVEGLLDTTLDMDPDQDGTCTELSAGLEFEAGEIFIVD